MKKLILLLVFTPIISFSQNHYSKALTFHNDVRSYYDVDPLILDDDLTLEAQIWAEQMAENDEFKVSSDGYGENIFYVSKDYGLLHPKDFFLEATVSWLLDSDDINCFNQIIYEGAKKVGFGKAMNDNYIYIVAKYDKLHENK